MQEIILLRARLNFMDAIYPAAGFERNKTDLAVIAGLPVKKNLPDFAESHLFFCIFKNKAHPSDNLLYFPTDWFTKSVPSPYQVRIKSVATSVLLWCYYDITP